MVCCNNHVALQQIMVQCNKSCALQRNGALPHLVQRSRLVQCEGLVRCDRKLDYDMRKAPPGDLKNKNHKNNNSTYGIIFFLDLTLHTCYSIL